MPFHVRDPWRLQYFADVACPDHVHIPIDDIDCWEWFPEHRHVYDKLRVASSQGVACGTMADVPSHFPVFAKPRVNLKGMGMGIRAISTVEEFRAHMTPDMMWMELFTGPHVSTDCAVIAGKVQWLRHATGAAFGDGMFECWTIHERNDPALATYLSGWVQQFLPGYTGMINIETIGGRIIEAQIRFADQWCDIYGKAWLEAVVALYRDGCWPFADENRREGYSIPLFARHGLVPAHPTADQQAAICALPHVSSLQITFHEARPGREHPMPPGGFRLGIINCWNLEAGYAARRELAKAFNGVTVIIQDRGRDSRTDQ